MARIYPQDTHQMRSERKSFKALMSLIDTECWCYLGQDNFDHGVDHKFELIEEGQYKGYRILSQVKSRNDPEVRGNVIVFDFPVKTANYAVGCAEPFIFFFVDLKIMQAYYLCIQDFFMENKNKMKDLEKNSNTIRVFVPIENQIENDDLKEIAKSQYSYDEEKGIKKTR